MIFVPCCEILESGKDKDSAWARIWTELYHQGDIGEGSLVAVPHLVRIHRQLGTPDWNTYAIVAVIELARCSPQSGRSGFGESDYEQALRDLAAIGLEELSTRSRTEKRSEPSWR